LKDAGAKSISVYVVHLVSEKGIEKISPHVKEFLVTDTIETPISKISVIEHLAEKLRL
jgi:phosphoribosylpyrophosphate synthetase